MKPIADMLINCFDQKKIKIDSETIKSRNRGKLLGIKIDKKLNFNAHVEGLCKRASQKMNALARIILYMYVFPNNL